MKRIGHVLVRETHGIRRFLYPLAAILPLPEQLPEGPFRLRRVDGESLPCQATSNPGALRLDFAASMSPYEVLELDLESGVAPQAIDDPLQITHPGRICCKQKRFALEFDRMALLHNVTYDGRSHLRAPVTIVRNGQVAGAGAESAFAEGPLAAQMSASGEYPDGCRARTILEISACKSWAVLTHVLTDPRPVDKVAFHLPFAAGGPELTCDFGIGGGLYARLHAETAPEVVWRTEFRGDGGVNWSLHSAGRLDYAGEEQSGGSYRSQRWLHLIDRDKALAVAVTSVPKDCRTLTVVLSAEGGCRIAFQLADTITGPAAIGACYHFLPGIPALSAATNPQSILLPPVVEAVWKSSE